MSNSYPFPIYTGVLEPQHYKQIGSAIWLFLWCISSTTKEIERDGVTWGVVLGNKPIKTNTLEPIFGVTERTIRDWINKLEKHGYIKVTRAPYGLIFTVKNSKKYPVGSEENDRSGKEENFRSEGSDRKIISDHSEENFRSNKDIIKDLKDTTSITDPEIEPFEQSNPFVQLLDAYCQLNKRLDIHVKPKEREAMGKMVAGGMPNPFTIRTMEILLEEKREREGNSFKLPTSFLYYENGIWEAWRNENALTVSGSSETVVLGKTQKQQSRQQKQLNLLAELIEEERRNEQSGSNGIASTNYVHVSNV